MSIQTTLGKAFEYACIAEIYNLLSESQSVEILGTSSFNIAKNFMIMKIVYCRKK